MTAGNQAALTAQEWLLGINRGTSHQKLHSGYRYSAGSCISEVLATSSGTLICSLGPLMMSLRPEHHVENPYAEIPADKSQLRQLNSLRFQMGPADVAVTNINLDFMEKVTGEKYFNILTYNFVFYLHMTLEIKRKRTIGLT